MVREIERDVRELRESAMPLITVCACVLIVLPRLMCLVVVSLLVLDLVF